MTDYKANTRKKITAFIVEDEARSSAALQKLLAQSCPEVEVIGAARTVAESIEQIDRLTPQVVFLDIALPDGDGFNVLEGVHHEDFRVIFVTAYDKYAIRAFEFSALHYLLKPVDQVELRKAIDRYGAGHEEESEDYREKLEALKININNQDDQRIMLPTAEGFEFIALDCIVRLESSHNYTHCFLSDGRDVLVSRPLISFENILRDFQFARIHNKHMINLKYVRKYVRGSGGSVKMHGNAEVPVSKSRKAEFMEKLNQFAHSI